MRWDRDLKRRCDGSFVYEGGEQWAPGKATDYWDDSYTYWGNPTAYYLLHAAIPLKKLYITGKNANPANELSAQAVSNAIWAAEFTSLCGGYTKEQLVAALGEWDPIVRFNAATELATRSLTATEVNSLITMAENPADANQREAACTALGCLKATSAVPALTRRLTDTDIWVRAKAAKALGADERGGGGLVRARHAGGVCHQCGAHLSVRGRLQLERSVADRQRLSGRDAVQQIGK